MNPFATPGNWLRCALHAHTTASDGEAPPSALAAHYARAGYDVLATTDHWNLTAIESDEILVIPSSELNASLPNGRDGHVLAFGIDRLPERGLQRRLRTRVLAGSNPAPDETQPRRP